MQNNEVVIIGGDHHNTLAIIRNLAKNKVKFKVLIHSSCTKKPKEISLFHSKFVKEIEIVEEKEKEIVNWLIRNKKNNLQIVFPSSDLAEYSVDNNYNILKDYYILPGFKDKPGKVVKLMNKYEQKKWADKHSIPMAKSWNIIKKRGIFDMPDDITIPCIIKPNISALGSKGDIKIINSIEQLDEELRKFNDSEYDNLIIQKYLKKEYELCAIGYITPDYNCGRVVYKIRENNGSLTYAKFENDEDVPTIVNSVIQILKKEGYCGLYDIEFLVCSDYIYLNEINFRHSGNGYALIKSGIMAPYYLYLYFIKQKYKYNSNVSQIYFMDDFNYLNSIKKKKVSIYTFIHDFIHSSAHSIFDLGDLGVFCFKIKSIIVKKLKKDEK